MKIVGISSDFHDSSVAVVVDGEIVATAAEERFSYQKHDPSFPSLALERCLSKVGLSFADIDHIAYHEDPVVKFSRVLSSRMHNFPAGFLAFSKSMQELILGQLWIKLDIFKQTGISSNRIHFIPHHLSHAAYAYAVSGMESSAILVVDAVGEWSSTTWFTGKRTNGRFEIAPQGVVPYPHSLGMLYSAFTGFLGFRVNDAECSTMALASFGKPKYLEKVRRILKVQADGTYELDLGYFDFSDPERLPVSKAFYELFGEPRSFRTRLPFSSLPSKDPLVPATEKDQYYADVASSVQAGLEEVVLGLCSKIARETGCNNLCLAGGVALNSSMNGRVIRESPFQEVFIPPDPGDGGGALGAALYLASRLESSRVPAVKSFSPYLGLSYDESSTIDLLPSIRSEELYRGRIIPSDLGKVVGLSAERAKDFDDLADQVAHDLSDGKIVGWFQGCFENGPRALGNRSLLIDPRNASAAKRLSQRVKLRAAFRPYACSVTEDDAPTLFPRLKSGTPPGLRWMSSTEPLAENGRERVSQATHVDGTTRPQILSKESNPRYHRLLEAWRSRSGFSAVLNTSFNESGYPMVSSPIDALLMYLRTDIDTLVLNDTIVRKRH